MNYRLLLHPKAVLQTSAPAACTNIMMHRKQHAGIHTTQHTHHTRHLLLPQTCQDEIGAIKYIEALNLGVSPTAAALKLLSKHAHPLSRGEASSGSASSLRRNKSYYSSMATGSKASSAGSSAAKRKLQELELLNSIGVGRQGGREGGDSAAGGAGGTAGAAGAAGAGTTASRTADRSFSALSKVSPAVRAHQSKT